MWPFRKRSAPNPASMDGGSMPSPPDAVELYTNAPSSWPPIRVNPAVLAGPNAGPFDELALFELSVSAAMKQAGLELVKIRHTALTDSGAIQVSLLVQHDGELYGVFMYPTPTSEDASDYDAASSAIATLGMRAAYVSTGPLPPLLPDHDTNFHVHACLTPLEQGLQRDDYLMWWPAEDGERFVDTAACAALTRIYAGCDGIESHLVGLLHPHLGIDLGVDTQGRLVRIPLPEDSQLFSVRGPEDRPFIVSLSAEKGIRFHFPKGTTPPAYRDRYLAHFAGYVEFWRSVFLKHEVELDTYGDLHPASWWALLMGYFSQEEHVDAAGNVVGAQPAQAVGKLLLNFPEEA